MKKVKLILALSLLIGAFIVFFYDHSLALVSCGMSLVATLICFSADSEKKITGMLYEPEKEEKPPLKHSWKTYERWLRLRANFLLKSVIKKGNNK